MTVQATRVHRWRRAGSGRWWQPRVVCPSWCASDHQCTASGGAGEHRSSPLVWVTPYGRLVAVRSARADSGTGQLTIRAVIDLPADSARARVRARHALVYVDLAIRTVLGLPTRTGANRRPTGF